MDYGMNRSKKLIISVSIALIIILSIVFLFHENFIENFFGVRNIKISDVVGKNISIYYFDKLFTIAACIHKRFEIETHKMIFISDKFAERGNYEVLLNFLKNNPGYRKIRIYNGSFTIIWSSDPKDVKGSGMDESQKKLLIPQLSSFDMKLIYNEITGLILPVSRKISGNSIYIIFYLNPDSFIKEMKSSNNNDINRVAIVSSGMILINFPEKELNDTKNLARLRNELKNNEKGVLRVKSKDFDEILYYTTLSGVLENWKLILSVKRKSLNISAGGYVILFLQGLVLLAFLIFLITNLKEKEQISEKPEMERGMSGKKKAGPPIPATSKPEGVELAEQPASVEIPVGEKETTESKPEKEMLSVEPKSEEVTTEKEIGQAELPRESETEEIVEEAEIEEAEEVLEEEIEEEVPEVLPVEEVEELEEVEEIGEAEVAEEIEEAEEVEEALEHGEEVENVEEVEEAEEVEEIKEKSEETGKEPGEEDSEPEGVLKSGETSEISSDKSLKENLNPLLEEEAERGKEVKESKKESPAEIGELDLSKGDMDSEYKDKVKGTAEEIERDLENIENNKVPPLKDLVESGIRKEEILDEKIEEVPSIPDELFEEKLKDKPEDELAKLISEIEKESRFDKNDVSTIKQYFISILNRLNLKKGVILFNKNDYYFPVISVDISRVTQEKLRFTPDERIVKNFFTKGKVLYIKDNVFESNEIRSKFSDKDKKYVNSLLFYPVKTNDVIKAIVLLIIKEKSFDYKEGIESLKELNRIL